MEPSEVHHLSFYPIIGNNNPEKVGGTDINIWIIILTAIIFYAVLSWYNFFLALYNYMICRNSESERCQNNSNDVGYSFGVAIIWTTIAIVIYMIFRDNGMLTYPILNKARNYFFAKRDLA